MKEERNWEEESKNWVKDRVVSVIAEQHRQGAFDYGNDPRIDF